MDKIKKQMTYFQYIFSDKKSRIYWIVIFILIAFLTAMRAIILFNSNSYFDFSHYVELSLYFILFLFIYIGYYTSSYFEYKTHYTFKAYHKSKIDKITKCTVLINQDKFTIKPLYQSNDVKISVPLIQDSFQICKIDDSLIIFGQVYDFGTFKRHIKPLQIDLKHSTDSRLKHAFKPYVSDIKISHNDLEIKFKNSINGINKLVIIDYLKQKID